MPSLRNKDGNSNQRDDFQWTTSSEDSHSQPDLEKQHSALPPRRPYRIYEQERKQRQERKQQREARTAASAAAEQHDKNKSSGGGDMDTDPEQPRPQSEQNKSALTYYAEEFVSPLVGAECQLGTLMLLLLCTCIAVGLMNRHYSGDEGDDVDNDLMQNITDSETMNYTTSMSSP